MTILQQPDALSLSGNIKKFRIGTTKAVSFVLRQGDREIVSQSYEPGSDNIVVIDIKDIVHSRLNFLFQNTALVYEQTSLVANFAAIIAGTEVLFRAIRTGVDHLADTADNFLIQNFLTWQPSIKPVTYHSPEFLTYYSVVSSVAKLHAYFTDDSGSVISEMDIVLSDFVAGRAYTIPLQYASVSEKLDNKLPAYYDVWVEADGKRLTYIQRYYVSDMKSEEEQWILFENSLGGIDTFRAYGTTSLSCEHTHNIAEIDDVSSEYRVDTERKFQKNTGYLDKKERVWLLDFFPSLKKYIYTGAYMRSVVVVESNVTYTDKELPSNYTFTYKYADARPFLNIPRIDIPSGSINITVPEVGSFTVPPRLVEFPRLPLSEGALFPVQEPYAEKWNTTTVSSLSDFIIDRISGSYDGGGGVGHQHTNIDLLNLLSYTADYLLTAGKKIKAGYADEAYPFIKGVAQELIDFAYGLTSDSVFTRNYTPGMLGTGGCLKTDPITGKSSIEVDELYVRLKAIFDSLETKKTTHVGGQQMQTLANIKCSKIELLDKEALYDANDSRLLDADGLGLSGAVSALVYRCYFLADDGEKAIVNEFAPGDFAQSREFNIKPGMHENVSNRYYWRYVVAVGDNYIDLSVTDCDKGSDIPEAGDTIIQLGNRTDVNRQNAIITSAYGENAPSREMLAGINSYSLVDKVVIEEGFDRITNKPYTKNYGTSYVGTRDERSYVKCTDEKGIEICGTISLRDNNNKVWSVNKNGVNTVGDEEGKHIEIAPNTSDLRVYDSNNKVCTIIEGTEYDDISGIYNQDVPTLEPLDTSVIQKLVANIDSNVSPVTEDTSKHIEFNILKEDWFDTKGGITIQYKIAHEYALLFNGRASGSAKIKIAAVRYENGDLNSPAESYLLLNDEYFDETGGSVNVSYITLNINLPIPGRYQLKAYLDSSIKISAVNNERVVSRIRLNKIDLSAIPSGYVSRIFANGITVGNRLGNSMTLINKDHDILGKYLEATIENESAGIKLTSNQLLGKSRNTIGDVLGIYGIIPRIMAVGKIVGSATGVYISDFHCPDRLYLTAERLSVGKYKLKFPDAWHEYGLGSKAYVMLTGVGYAVGANSGTSPVKSTLVELYNQHFTVMLSDDDTPNDGSCYFELKLF